MQPGSGNIDTSPALSVDKSVVYVGNGDGIIFAILASNGSVVAQYNIGYYVIGMSVGVDGLVFSVSNRYVMCHSPSDLTLLWAVATDYPFYFTTHPAVDRNGTAYVGSTSNYLYAISKTGTIIWKYYSSNSILHRKYSGLFCSFCFYY